VDQPSDRLIALTISFEVSVKGRSARGKVKALHHHPSGLLRDTKILSHLHAGHGWVIRNVPNRIEPGLKREFAAFKNGARFA
jgi:hypothetical protein